MKAAARVKLNKPFAVAGWRFPANREPITRFEQEIQVIPGRIRGEAAQAIAYADPIPSGIKLVEVSGP